jgi:hypothetical protein
MPLLTRKVSPGVKMSSVPMAPRNMPPRPGGPAARVPWKPTAGLKDYSGRELTAEDEFFHPPPPELGTLLAAQTGLKTTRRETTSGAKTAMYLGLAGLLAACCVAIYQVNWDGPKDPEPWVVCAIVVFFVGAAGLLGIHAATKFRHLCSYVGTDGLALYEIKGGRAGTPTGQVFTFDKAAEIRRREVYQYTNGVQTGASFFLTWSDSARNVVFSISGQAPSKAGRPKPTNHRYLVGRAAEAAWNQHISDAVEEMLRRDGKVTFTIGKTRVVRIGPGVMELSFGERHQVIPTADIRRLSLVNGQFSIRGPDATLFGKAGKFDFAYSELGNAQLFAVCCEKLLGRPLE